MQYNGKEIELSNEYLEFEEASKPYNIRHRAYFFSRDIIRFVAASKHDAVFISLYDQLVRSATSIGANIIEGRAGSSKKDFLNYCKISLKSANETKYWLCLIRDTMPVNREEVSGFVTEADELSKIIASIIVNTLNSASTGE